MSAFLSIEQLQKLVHLMERSDAVELEVKCAREQARVILRKANDRQNYLSSSQADHIMLDSSHSDTRTHHTVVAGVVGVFWLGKRRAGQVPLAVGDVVEAGQPVGVIRSLNILSEIEAPVSGRIIEIILQDGQLAEYGQPLLVLEAVELSA